MGRVLAVLVASWCCHAATAFAPAAGGTFASSGRRAALAHAHHPGPGHAATGQRRAAPRRSAVLRMQEDEPIPDAIVEAEAKATPMRPVRQQLYVLVGAVALLAGGGLAAGKLGGVEFGGRSFSPQVTEALCAVLVGGSALFLYLEEQTRQQNLRRILERFTEQKAAGPAAGPNRDARRAREKEAKLQKKEAGPKQKDMRDLRKAVDTFKSAVGPSTPPQVGVQLWLEAWICG